MGPTSFANVIAVGVAVVTAAVTYGVNEANITALQHRADSQSEDIHNNANQLAAHDKEIAVIETQYADIIRRLDEIDHKLDSKP